MTRLLDVVNFNADASCLDSASWLSALRGGDRSLLYRWLEGFVAGRRRVVLGLIGATVADIATHNPESIALVNQHPETFQLLLRPFSHDVALLRSVEGFRCNVELGFATIRREFDQITPYFLPPEFMLTNEQLSELAALGCAGVFINASRFNEEAQHLIPRDPYTIEGIFGRRLTAIPLEGGLTAAYLTTLHEWDNQSWHTALLQQTASSLAGWRDGESWLLLPDGLERELAWLASEDPRIERIFVEELVAGAELAEGEAAGRSYPVHSFSDWVKEFRMFGYLHRLQAAESRLGEQSAAERALWLQAINSDVLSSVEKDSPVVTLRERGEQEERAWRIVRSTRWLEGEEYLALLEGLLRPPTSASSSQYLATSSRPHMIKLRGRLAYLERLLERG